MMVHDIITKLLDMGKFEKVEPCGCTEDVHWSHPDIKNGVYYFVKRRNYNWELGRFGRM